MASQNAKLKRVRVRVRTERRPNAAKTIWQFVIGQNRHTRCQARDVIVGQIWAL